MASAVFVSGRDPETVKALDLNFSFIKFDRFKIDYENKTVTSRFLWGKATAAYREGYGVTLLRVPMPMNSSNRFVLSPMRACL